jgi:hypothetical protein
MWKKQEDTVGTQPEFASKQMPESLGLDGEALIKAYREHLAEKGKVAVSPQKVFTEGQDQPWPPPVTMATYTEAVNEFTKNGTAFIEQLPLLTKARDAYEQAMRASAELHKVLDAGEENLRTFISQLEQVVNVHMAQPVPDKKKPEPAKVEAIRGTDESTGSVKTFP